MNVCTYCLGTGGQHLNISSIDCPECVGTGRAHVRAHLAGIRIGDPGPDHINVVSVRVPEDRVDLLDDAALEVALDAHHEGGMHLVSRDAVLDVGNVLAKVLRLFEAGFEHGLKISYVGVFVDLEPTISAHVEAEGIVLTLSR
jgi:hypothetical protein